MFGIVIDTRGLKVEFVHIFEDGTIDSYELKDGESVIGEGWQVANGMNKPRWNGTEWIDTDPLPPAEQEPTPPDKNTILSEEILTLTEQNVDLDFRVLMLEMASI